ncbi:MAG: hypothetical protein Devi2KO_39780 [Devosia indica]
MVDDDVHLFPSFFPRRARLGHIHARGLEDGNSGGPSNNENPGEEADRAAI